MKLLLVIAVLTASIVADALFNNAHYTLVVSTWARAQADAMGHWLPGF